MTREILYIDQHFGPTKEIGAIQVTFRDEGIGNCGLTLIQDIATWIPNGPYYGRGTVSNADALYRLLAERLNFRLRTNYVMSDNIAKVGTIEAPTFKLDPDYGIISTGGFASWLMRNKYGRVSCSKRMCNENHARAATTSIIQLWIWTTPRMLELEKSTIQNGYIERAWLRGRERIFKTPKRFLQSVSTKW